jgi:hypothetical protein
MKIGAPVPRVSTIYNTQGMQGLDYYKDYPISAAPHAPPHDPGALL